MGKTKSKTSGRGYNVITYSRTYMTDKEAAEYGPIPANKDDSFNSGYFKRMVKRRTEGNNNKNKAKNKHIHSAHNKNQSIKNSNKTEQHNEDESFKSKKQSINKTNCFLNTTKTVNNKPPYEINTKYIIVLDYSDKVIPKNTNFLYVIHDVWLPSDFDQKNKNSFLILMYYHKHYRFIKNQILSVKANVCEISGGKNSTINIDSNTTKVYKLIHSQNLEALNIKFYQKQSI